MKILSQYKTFFLWSDGKMNTYTKTNAAGTKKAVIIKQTDVERKNIYNVQIWHFVPGLQAFVYSGFGKFCANLPEACKYACIELR